MGEHGRNQRARIDLIGRARGLNTRLQVLLGIGMTGLLLDTPMTEEQRECAETVRESTETLLRIISRFSLSFFFKRTAKIEESSVIF